MFGAWFQDKMDGLVKFGRWFRDKIAGLGKFGRWLRGKMAGLVRAQVCYLLESLSYSNLATTNVKNWVFIIVFNGLADY